MKQDHEVHIFSNLNQFMVKVKHEALKTFLITFQNASDFIEKYNDDLLTYDIINYECQRYLFIEGPDYHIYKSDVERLVKQLYKQLVEQVLNKLVDEGELELCWDKKEENFFWRPVKEKQDGRSRRYKKKGGRGL